MRISDWSSDVCSSDLCESAQAILLSKERRGQQRIGQLAHRYSHRADCNRRSLEGNRSRCAVLPCGLRCTVMAAAACQGETDRRPYLLSLKPVRHQSGHICTDTTRSEDHELELQSHSPTP